MVGPVAQVSHPTDIAWSPGEAGQLLLSAAAELPVNTKVVLTGGGFLTLTYPHPPPSPRLVLQGAFLQQLTAWTEQELLDVLRAVEQGRRERDFIIGVDVLVNGNGSGLFALWIGQGGWALVAKRFPVNGEDRYLAGVEANVPVHGPRIVQTSIGPALLLVCHDAQAYNRRQRGSVGNASWVTPRARAMQELHAARRTPGLAWALNLVHWVGGENNTQTFATSYSQMRTDFPNGDLNVVGSFGYEPDVPVTAVPELLQRMTAPPMNLPKVVFQRVAATH
jgi:hypothetical protein